MKQNVALPRAAALLDELRDIVGAGQVLTSARATQAYRTGFRSAEGSALAVVRPRSLAQLWRVLKACTSSNTIVILQAANTGLTGGSTPLESYDRDAVIISTLLMDKIYVIDEGRQVICLPGATLDQLERALIPWNREPHSVIGSSCIGASVIGGVCNNSGGALVSRGPAYTEMALFARLAANGELELVNHLCVRLGQGAEEMLDRLDRGEFAAADVEHDPQRRGSDHDYCQHVREVEADSPARFNADPRRLFEASGSAGKMAILAVRLDTFPKVAQTGVFYIGANDPAELTQLRRHVLKQFDSLPIAGEYLHRTMYDVAARYGKDLFLAIQLLGTRRLPAFFRAKRFVDRMLSRLGLSATSGDRLAQFMSRLWPRHLPSRMNEFRDRFEHHLILKMGGAGIAQAREYLRSRQTAGGSDFFECTEDEARKAFLHRFVAAGAAIRYAAVHDDEVAGIVALDVALKRSDSQWREELTEEIRGQVHHSLYYGHFFCHVFHQDYLVLKPHDPEQVKKLLLKLQDERGAEYPAEHNVGHSYLAKTPLSKFYRELDPRNGFNPGIGQTSRSADWR